MIVRRRYQRRLEAPVKRKPGDEADQPEQELRHPARHQPNPDRQQAQEDYAAVYGRRLARHLRGLERRPHRWGDRQTLGRGGTGGLMINHCGCSNLAYLSAKLPSSLAAIDAAASCGRWAVDGAGPSNRDAMACAAGTAETTVVVTGCQYDPAALAGCEKSKSFARSPRSQLFSRTSGRLSPLPSVLGSSRCPLRNTSSMNLT